MKHILLLTTTIFLIGLSSCDDDPIEPEVEETETEEIDLNNYHVAFELDGVAYSFVFDGGLTTTLYVGQSGSINSVGPPSEGGVVGRSGGFEKINEGVDITNQFEYTNGEFAGGEDNYQAAMAEKFTPGSYTYYSSDDEEGFEIEYYTDVISLTTETGDQTGSSFVISEIVEVGAEDFFPNIVIKGTFNCTLYNEAMESFNVENGTYYVLFEV